MSILLNRFNRIREEAEMRAGNVILTLGLVLILFGGLLVHSFNQAQVMKDMQQELAQAHADLQTLKTQNQALDQENKRLNGQVVGLTDENSNLHLQMEGEAEARQALADRIAKLEGELVLYRNAHPFMAWLVSSSTGRLAAALIVIPGLPVSLSAVYFVKRTRKEAPLLDDRAVDLHNSHVIHTALTPGEFQLIIRQRRSRAASRMSLRLKEGNDDEIAG